MGVLSARPRNRTLTKGNNMKAYSITIALVAAGLLAVVAAVAGVRSPNVGVDGVFGFAAVFALLAIAASDYRFGGRLFSK